jgi:S1-C subfamily serine protease
MFRWSCISRIAAGVLLLAGCDGRPSRNNAANYEPVAKQPEPPTSKLKYPRSPQSLAEINPYGLHHFRNGTRVEKSDRDPELDATPFGRKAIELREANAAQLIALPKWRKLTANEIFEMSERLRFSKKEQDKVLRAKLLGRAAAMDHGNAQGELARCYAKGLGVRKDIKTAAWWARKASQLGSEVGAHVLFVCYANGWAVRQDKAKARELLVLAARRENVWSQAVLGQCLLGDSKLGFEVNLEAGRKWLNVAASQPLDARTRAGKAAGLNGLGVMHEQGKGVPKNETEALAHYYLARSIGEEPEDVKVYNRNIRQRESEMSPSARQYSQLRAQELHPIYFTTPQPVSTEETAATIGFGSGVFVTEAGHILTAAHVIENASKVMAHVGGSSVEAEIVAVDYPNDVALLKVAAKVDAAPVRHSVSVALGNGVFTIGFPNMLLQGTEPKFTEGTISSTSGMRDDPRQFQVSVQVQPGNSGGALFDENGNVVGLVVSRLDDEATTKLTGSLPQNVNYAVKSSYALPLIESLKTDLLAEQRPSWFRRLDREEVVGNAKKASVPLVVQLRPERQ